MELTSQGALPMLLFSRCQLCVVYQPTGCSLPCLNRTLCCAFAAPLQVPQALLLLHKPDQVRRLRKLVSHWFGGLSGQPDEVP